MEAAKAAETAFHTCSDWLSSCLPHQFIIFSGFLATPRVVSVWLVGWLIPYIVVYTLLKAPCASIHKFPFLRLVLCSSQSLSTKPCFQWTAMNPQCVSTSLLNGQL